MKVTGAEVRRWCFYGFMMSGRSSGSMVGRLEDGCIAYIIDPSHLRVIMRER